MLKIPFFRLGTWRHPKYGELRIDQPMIDRLLANFKAGLPGSKPYVRLGHDKDAADAKATFGDTPALAWVKDLVQEGSVLYALADPTDPKVADWVKTKRYRFASAEYDPNHISRETGQPVGPVLSAIGLTNEPFLTRLPEAVVLAAPADTFYLDCEEVKSVKMSFTEWMKKLAGAFGVELDGAPAPADPPATATQTTPPTITLPPDIQAKLAQFDELKAKVDAQDAETKKLATQAEADRKARRQAEVEKLATDLVAEGIPPAMIEQVKPLLLADTGATVGKIKLANGQEQDATSSDLIIQSLRALPADQRVKFGQTGSQQAPDALAKLAETAKEDVLALGGAVTQDGKFKL